ncbi:hypothetical protein O0L34_g3336 [Tuta absoluta]|nr:hypothetical protein O0L34_g3336 [Tuta absoluta]
MREDIEFNVKFCALVEKYPAIYDFNRSDCIRLVQEQIWEKIAKQVNESVQDCRDRWRNIRNRYCKCHNRRMLAARDASVAKVKEYYLGPHLRFIDKFLRVKPRKSNNRPKVEKEAVEDTNEAIEDDNFDDDDDNDSSENEESNQSFVKNSEKTFEEPESFFISKRSRSSTEDVEDTRTSDDAIKNPLEQYFPQEIKRNNAKKDTVETVDSSDSDFCFLKSLLPDMAEMTAAQKRQFKIRVMSLAGDILDGHNASKPMAYRHRKS